MLSGSINNTQTHGVEWTCYYYLFVKPFSNLKQLTLADTLVQGACSKYWFSSESFDGTFRVNKQYTNTWERVILFSPNGNSKCRSTVSNISCVTRLHCFMIRLLPMALLGGSTEVTRCASSGFPSSHSRSFGFSSSSSAFSIPDGSWSPCSG